MKHFQRSNYAVNKYKKGIVYHFQDGSSVEITLEDYLRDNPGKNETDFQMLKELSDQIYYEQVLEETLYYRKTSSIGKLEETNQLATKSLDKYFEEKEDHIHIFRAARELYHSGLLTDIQKKRFTMHFMEGLSYRKIAELENVHFTSVQESIEACIKKMKKIFEKF